jgi:hypothetical protein
VTTFGPPRSLDPLRAIFIRNAWLCPFLALALIAVVLAAFGLSVGTAILIAFLVVCPAIMVWGLVVTLRRPRRSMKSTKQANGNGGLDGR